MYDSNRARETMVDCQIGTAGVVSPGILQAFQTIPREKFLPQTLQRVAYTDECLPVGPGRFLPEPGAHARLIEAASPEASDVALDIGGATGYSAAILSSLVTTVIALEDRQEYLDHAASVWNDLGACNIAGIKAPLTRGAPEHAPYNLIFINGAVTEIPAQLAQQLTDGGRMVAIVKKPGQIMGQAVLVRGLGGTGFSSHILFECAGEYLPGFEPKPAFQFS